MLYITISSAQTLCAPPPFVFGIGVTLQWPQQTLTRVWRLSIARLPWDAEIFVNEALLGARSSIELCRTSAEFEHRSRIRKAYGLFNLSHPRSSLTLPRPVFAFGSGQPTGRSGNEISLPQMVNDSIKSIGCGETHSFAITTRGALYGWGASKNGELGIGRR